MGLNASAAGTILSTGGAYTQAQGQKSALQSQAASAEFNSKVAGWQASDAIRNGQTAEENQYLKVGAIAGAQRAQMAANGVDLGSGSANDVLTTTEFMGKRDALQIHDNAMLQAWGYRTQSQTYLNQASQLKSSADAISPLMSAGASLLTGAGKVADSWDKTAKANGTPDFGTTIKSKWSSMWGDK